VITVNVVVKMAIVVELANIVMLVVNIPLVTVMKNTFILPQLNHQLQQPEDVVQVTVSVASMNVVVRMAIVEQHQSTVIFVNLFTVVVVIITIPVKRRDVV